MTTVDAAFPTLQRQRHAAAVAALVVLFGDMEPDVQARFESGAKRLIAPSWDTDLAALILALNIDTATGVAERVAKALDADTDPTKLAGWLEANATAAGGSINAHAEASIRAVPDDITDPVRHVFGILADSGSDRLAQNMVTTSVNFAANDTAEHAGASAKTWQVNSRNPRSAHAAVSGQTVGISGTFSNGMRRPGDWAGGIDNVAGCKCSLMIVK